MGFNGNNIPDSATSDSISAADSLAAPPAASPLASAVVSAADEAASVDAASAEVTARVDVGPRVSGSETIWRPPPLVRTFPAWPPGAALLMSAGVVSAGAATTAGSPAAELAMLAAVSAACKSC